MQRANITFGIFPLNTHRKLLLWMLPALAIGLHCIAACGLPSTPDDFVPEADGPVFAILQSGDHVYVGGEFTTIGGVSRNRLAAFHSRTGEIDPDWHPNITRTESTPSVRALLVYNDKLYVGGLFDTVNGSVTRNSLAAFELAGDGRTGLVESTWNPDIRWDSGTGSVNRLVSDGSLLYAGGFYDSVNGSLERHSLAAFEFAGGGNTGVADSLWHPSLRHINGGLGVVYGLVIEGDRIYAGGGFDVVNSFQVGRSSLAVFELAGEGRTGIVDANWNPDPRRSPSGGIGSVMVLLVEDTALYVGGVFDTVNGSVARRNLAAFELAGGSNTGAADPDWNPNVGTTASSVDALATDGSQLFVGGHFATVNVSVTRNDLAALELAGDGNTGLVDPEWDPNLSNDILTWGAPSASVTVPSGHGILVGGYVTEVGGEPHNHLIGFGTFLRAAASVPEAIWADY